jgi:organic hydroperoxide reductase OsmC/OhrA
MFMHSTQFPGFLGGIAQSGTQGSKVHLAPAWLQRVDVQVAFGRDPMDGLYMLTADLRIALPGVERRLAEGLVRNAERLCPYTKMVRQGAAGVVTLA